MAQSLTKACAYVKQFLQACVIIKLLCLWEYHMLKRILKSYKGFTPATWIHVSVAFINTLGSMVTFFFSLYLVTVLNFSIRKASLVIGTQGMGAIISAYCGGILCTYVDPRLVVIVALFCAAVIFCIIPLLHHYYAFIIFACILGMSLGLFRPANNILLLRGYKPREYAKVLGLLRSMQNLGVGIASVMGGIIAYISYSLLFYFNALSSFIACICVYKFIKTTSTIAANNSAQDAVNPSQDNLKMFIAVLTLMFINYVIFYQILGMYPIYLGQHYSFTTKAIGLLFFINSVIIFLFQVPILDKVSVYNQLIVAGIGELLIAVGYALMPLTHFVFYPYMNIIFLTLGEILFMPTIFSLALKFSKAESQTKNIGLIITLNSSAQMLAPICGGMLYVFQAGNILWYLCGIMGGLSFIGFLTLAFII